MSDGLHPKIRMRGMKGSLKAIESAERRKLALEHRRNRLTYDEIGQKMGIGKVAAYNLVRRAIDRLPREAAEHVKSMELADYDDATRISRTLMLDTDEEIVLKAIDRLLRTSERRCKLLGIDAPTKIQSSGDGTNLIPDGSTPEQELLIIESYAEVLRTRIKRGQT